MTFFLPNDVNKSSSEIIKGYSKKYFLSEISKILQVNNSVKWSALAHIFSNITKYAKIKLYNQK